MAPVVQIPDAVTLALPYVRDMLADASWTVEARVPSPRPDKLVVLRRAGGNRRLQNILGLPRIAVQVWHPVEFDALQMADDVAAILLAAPGRVAGVSRAVSFAGPVPIPDATSDVPRALTTVEWQVKGITQEE